MIDEKKLIEDLKEHFDICEINGKVMYSDHIITTDDYEDLAQFINNQPKVGEWIPVSEGMPPEHDTVFAKFKGSSNWNDAMFAKRSDDVNVTIEYSDGKRQTCTMYTTDGKWKFNSSLLQRTVVAWMPLPKPYKGGTE